MCLRRAPEEYIAGAALDRAGLTCLCNMTTLFLGNICYQMAKVTLACGDARLVCNLAYIRCVLVVSLDPVCRRVRIPTQ
jgi:hypothetical protein